MLKIADQDEMIAAIEYAHLHGCRLYMTVNTLFKENELGELYEYLLPYYKAGLDGVIVQDLGGPVLYSGAVFRAIELHASTQMTITSVYGAKELKRLGCCRVVPAREVSLEEIRRIYDETGMDIETFVHGGAVLLLFRTVPYEQPDRGQKRKQGPVRPDLPPAVFCQKREGASETEKSEKSMC